MKITCVTFDCADPAAQARFWNAALGGQGVTVAADGSGATCRLDAHAPYLEFVRVPEGKVVKNRVHLGCAVDSLAGLDPERDRLAALGATFAWEEEFPPSVAAHYRNVVLRDPEGNEFCLGAGTPPGSTAG